MFSFLSRPTFALVFLVLLVFSVPAQQAEVVNNTKKEFLPNTAGTAAKLVNRDGIVSQYLSEQSATVSVGIKSYDNDVLLIYLYVRNNSPDPVAIDPATILVNGVTTKGESVSLSVFDPVKKTQDRIAPLEVLNALATKPNFRPIYDALELRAGALLAGDILPGEQISRLVLLKQPYGPPKAVQRGPNTISVQTELLLKDFTVTVPLAGKDYTFSFTVNNDKK